MSDELIRASGELGEKVDRLELTVSHLATRTDRNEQGTRRVGIALLGGLALVLLLGWSLWQQHLTAVRLESLTQQSICPVYGLVIGGYDPTTRALNPNGSYPGSAREKYDQGFDVMRQAWAPLGCTSSQVIPKRIDS